MVPKGVKIVKVLKVNLKAPLDEHFIIKMKNGEAKVTLVRLDADRNEHVGTYLNIATITIDTANGRSVASIRSGAAYGIKEIRRVGRTLSCELEP